MCLNDHSCLFCFGYVVLQTTGSAVGQRLSVYCPDNNLIPLTDTDAPFCMEFISTNRAEDVKGNWKPLENVEILGF